jgi:hypothetical protein
MSHITKLAVVETTTAIWEYDPLLPNNRIVNGSLDSIAALRTLIIKVSISLSSMFMLLLTVFSDTIF